MDPMSSFNLSMAVMNKATISALVILDSNGPVLHDPLHSCLKASIVGNSSPCTCLKAAFIWTSSLEQLSVYS